MINKHFAQLASLKVTCFISLKFLSHFSIFHNFHATLIIPLFLVSVLYYYMKNQLVKYTTRSIFLKNNLNGALRFTFETYVSAVETGNLSPKEGPSDKTYD